MNDTIHLDHSTIEMRNPMCAKSYTHWRGKSNDRSQGSADHGRWHACHRKTQGSSIEEIFGVPRLCAFEQSEEVIGSQ